MKDEQPQNFLSICSSLNIEHDTGYATATICFNNWPFWKYHQPETLMLEGIHQFSSEIAALFDPDNVKNVYLPTMIKNFQTSLTLHKIISTQLLISGKCEMINNTCCVICNVRSASENEIIATAVIMVSKALLEISAAECGDYNPYLPLWEIERNSNKLPITTSVCFWFNNSHPLFIEHFPKNSLAPGSMLIEVVLKRLIFFYPQMSSIAFTGVKFFLPVRPDIPYYLHIRFSESDLTASFIIYFRNNEKRAAMGKIAFTLAESE